MRGVTEREAEILSTRANRVRREECDALASCGRMQVTDHGASSTNTHLGDLALALYRAGIR